MTIKDLLKEERKCTIDMYKPLNPSEDDFWVQIRKDKFVVYYRDNNQWVENLWSAPLNKLDDFIDKKISPSKFKIIDNRK